MPFTSIKKVFQQVSSKRQALSRRLPKSTHFGIPTVESLEIRQLFSAAPSGDLTEGDLSKWSTFADDGASASVSNDTSHVRAGSQSMLFETESGFDTGVRLTAPAEGWDLRTRNLVEFWCYGENDTPFGWQGNQPIVVLRSSGGSLTLTPNRELMSNHGWTKIHAPFAGDAQFQATTSGAFDMSKVTMLEIHQDTWDYGFRVFYDGLQFVNRDAADLPPSGPQPPAGVNPDAVAPRVLLYVFDPIMENLGARRQHEVYSWEDPVSLAQQVDAALELHSHGIVDYQLTTQVVDAHPYFVDGFQHTDASFAQAWSVRDFHNSQFDYVRFASENNIAARIDNGEIDEVWIYTGPISGTWESCMGGDGAYWINGPTQAIPSERAFPIMGLNFERGVAEALHSFGHRVEGTMDHIYATQGNHLNNNWDKFTYLNRYQAGLGGIGNIHFPVNGASDYDYANTTFVTSNADDWYNYPNFQGTTRSINFREWAPVGTDPHLGYMTWWYDHIPHFASRGPDFRLNNWWRYITDIDQFKSGNTSLSLTEGQPVVKAIAPATISREAEVSAQAWVDGALGRVDFYVDGVYQQTDTLSPFTFHWDASSLSAGNHVITMKAYDLQNGTEGVSQPVTVNVGEFADQQTKILPLSLTQITARPAIEWNDLPGAVRYDLWINNNTTGNSQYVREQSLTGTSYRSAVDLPLGSYRAWVRGIDANGVPSRWSAFADFRVSPPAVLFPMAKQQNSARPLVQWKALAGAANYDLWLNNLSTGQSQIVRNTGLTGTSWMRSIDLPLGQYRVWVRGIDVAGIPASWSAATSFDVVPGPVLMSPQFATFNRLPTFTWDAVVGATRYDVFLRDLNTGATIYYPKNLTATQWTPPTNLPDGPYRWWVQARSANNVNSLWSTPVDVYVGGRTTVISPEGTTADSTPVFSWRAVEGAARSELWVSDAVTQARVIHQTLLTSNSYTPTADLAKGNYRVWVRAVSTTGQYAAWSAEARITIVHTRSEQTSEESWLLASLFCGGQGDLDVRVLRGHRDIQRPTSESENRPLHRDESNDQGNQRQDNCDIENRAAPNGDSLPLQGQSGFYEALLVDELFTAMNDVEAESSYSFIS